MKDIRWTNRFHGADVRNASAASSDANDGWRRFGETARLLGRKKRRVKTTRATCGGCSSSTTGLISVCSTRAAAVVAVLLVVGLARFGMFVVIVRQLGVCVGMASDNSAIMFFGSPVPETPELRGFARSKRRERSRKVALEGS